MEFYDTAKTVEVKSYVNSAKSSIGSLSGTLEQRRERLRKLKEDALNIDKDKPAADKTTAADTEAKEKTTVDASKDKATADATKPEEGAAGEDIKTDSTDQAKEKKPS